MGGVKLFSSEVHPFILGTSILAVILIAALIRLWLLRRVEAALLKNRDALERQIVTQQRDLLKVRTESNEWRVEMRRQFDAFRAMASNQLGVEEKRFDDLMKRSEVRQAELQAALDMARHMCAELPAAKARVMQLEHALDIDGGEGLSVEDGSGLTPMPDVEAAPAAPRRQWEFPVPALPAMPVVDEDRVSELERKLANALQQNAALQQALTAARLRSRVKTKSPRPKLAAR